MADKNFIVKNGLEVGGQEVVSSSGVVTSAALGGQTLASTDSPTFNNLTLTNDIAVGGDLNLTGDLNITGDVNSLSVTDLDVTDQTITLGAGQVESASGGSGIVVGGSGASILWDETNSEWDFNKSVNIVTTSGNGITIDATQNASIRLDSDNNTTGPFMIRVNSDEFHIKNQSTSGFGTGGSFLKYTDGGSLQFLGDGLVVTSSDFVSIGHTDPDNRLHIQGNGVTGGIFVEDSNNSSVSPVIKVQGNRSDGNESKSFSGGLALSALQTNALANDGKHIGTIYFGTNHTDGTAANIAYSASISAELSGAANSATDMPTDLVFYTGSTGRALGTSNQNYGDEALRITAGGNIGIGNSSPQTKLFVGSGSGTEGITIYSGTTGEGQLRFADGTSGSSLYQGRIEYNHSTNKLFLGAGGTTPVSIDSSGNVGIGVTSPGSKLSISDSGTGIGLTNAASGNFNIGLLAGTGSPNAYIYQRANAPLLFGTNNAERMRVSSDGDIRINTTGQMGNATLTVKAYTNTNTGLMLQEYDTSNAYGLYTVTTDDSFRITRFVSGSYSDRLIIDSNGSFGINTSSLSTEASLFIGKQPSAGNQEGGQLVLQSSVNGSKAIHIDNYNNASVDYCRFMRGSDTGSEAVLGVWDITNTRFGIGTTTPATELHVKASSGDAEIRIEAVTNSDARLRFGDAADNDAGYIGYNRNSGFMNFSALNTAGESMRIDSSGNVNIGATTLFSGSTKLEVQYGLTVKHSTTIGQGRNIYMDDSAGALKFYNGYNVASLSQSGAWTNASDIAYKENIVDTEHGLDVVKLLQPRDYTLKSDSSSQTGFIAQELETHLPQFINGDEGEKGVNYGQLTAVLTKAIQEQQTIIDDLKSRLDEAGL